MCTSMIFLAQDGTNIYARTMEWGASDLHSELVLVPRGMSFKATRRERHRDRMEEPLRICRRQRRRSSVRYRWDERSRPDCGRTVLPRICRLSGTGLGAAGPNDHEC